jgi:hypothetical protein
VIKRPDGTIYRPRKITANAVTDEDEILCGVVVFGTHDIALAQPLADQYVAWQLDSGMAAADPCTVWWRDGFECGQRRWITDEKHGRGGVFFREVIERVPAVIKTGALCRDNGPEGDGDGSAQT